MKKIFLILFIISSCTNKPEGDIEKLLESKLLKDKCEAYYLIGESKDSSRVHILLENLYAPKIIHDRYFYGMSVYQCKITALKKISGKEPPNKITHIPDSINIKFYEDWALSNKFIKTQ